MTNSEYYIAGKRAELRWSYIIEYGASMDWIDLWFDACEVLVRLDEKIRAGND